MSEFDDTLKEITGGINATASEIQQEQAQTAPDESNAFEAALADKMQEAANVEKSLDTPEPGGGMER